MRLTEDHRPEREDEAVSDAHRLTCSHAHWPGLAWPGLALFDAYPLPLVVLLLSPRSALPAAVAISASLLASQALVALVLNQ